MHEMAGKGDVERNVGGVAAWVILRRCVELNTQVGQVHLAVIEEV